MKVKTLPRLIPVEANDAYISIPVQGVKTSPNLIPVEANDAYMSIPMGDNAAYAASTTPVEAVEEDYVIPHM